ncbi:sugar phosphate isomerase/epimerase family protein [Mangrovibacterium lignilyticum]|uniref:sugar phosphate isomerase/epimerase family protein n=1 Tax=Mangrovibacterium lignilyticum TaxID=2668052 RepID=UPI0013D62F43|nr:sugar phosphate isomerase/epimerase family protein [Mangrovibacterium lignilyticum]
MKKSNYKIISLFLLAALCLNTVSCQSASKKSEKEQQYKIAVVDLMILKRQKLSAFPLAKEIGAEGLEVDMGGLGKRPTFDNKLANDSLLNLFLQASKDNGIEICALSMSGFYAQSFPYKETAVQAVRDCITSMKKVGTKVGFLPLGVEGDLVQHPERREAIVERLKEVAKYAEEAEVVIGIETALDATGEVQLLDEIGSPAIQISFNFSNPLKAGRDLYQELEILGADRICQIHATNKDSVWLENDPEIDMQKVKSTLDKMGWSGWLIVERSRDANNPRDVRGNFGANVAYLKSIFQ